MNDFTKDTPTFNYRKLFSLDVPLNTEDRCLRKFPKVIGIDEIHHWNAPSTKIQEEGILKFLEIEIKTWETKVTKRKEV